MLVFRSRTYKMLERIAYREDPDQTASKQSDLGLCCLSSLSLQATSVRNLRTFTLVCLNNNCSGKS